MIYESNYLTHYGIKGQRWGQRRFQEEDGTYTAAGRERYRKSSGKTGFVSKADPKVSKTRLGLNFPRNKKKTVLDKLDEWRDRSVMKDGVSKGLKTNGVYDKEDGTKDMKRLQKDAKKDAEDMARAKAYYGEGAGNRRKQIRNRISERMKDPDYKAEYEKQLASQDMSKHQKAANRERKVQDAKNTAAKVGRGLKNILLGVGSTSLTAIAIYNAAKLTGADKKIAEFGKKAIRDISSKLRNMKKPSVKDYDWHGDDSSYRVPKSSYTIPEDAYKTRLDFVEKNNRTKRDRQRPWIDKDGAIHF